MRFETSKTGLKQVLEIAKELKEWFTPKGVKDIARNFKTHKALKATESGKVLGFAVFQVKGKKLEILWLAVKRNSQRKGIGKAMMQKLEKIAKSNGLKKISTKTVDESTSSTHYAKTRKFYYSQGFKKAKTVKNYWKGTGNNALFLEKTVV